VIGSTCSFKVLPIGQVSGGFTHPGIGQTIGSTQSPVFELKQQGQQPFVVSVVSAGQWEFAGIGAQSTRAQSKGSTHCSVSVCTQQSQHPFFLNTDPIGQSNGFGGTRQEVAAQLRGSTHF
jgi:hypothetical protein